MHVAQTDTFNLDFAIKSITYKYMGKTTPGYHQKDHAKHLAKHWHWTWQKKKIQHIIQNRK
jgi:hypothetical protein